MQPVGLVLPGDVQELTSFYSCDARTAIVEGLAQYLGRVHKAWHDGNDVRFMSVVADMPSVEVADDNAYPALAVTTERPGEFEYSGTDVEIALPGGLLLTAPTTLAVDLELTAYCTSKNQRTAIASLIEHAFYPNPLVAGDSGLELRIPFYFNAFANYTLMTIDVRDTSELVHRGINRLVCEVKGSILVYRLMDDPGNMNIKLRVEAIEGSLA